MSQLSAFRRVNAELEAKTAELVRQAEEVIVSEDMYFVFVCVYLGYTCICMSVCLGMPGFLSTIEEMFPSFTFSCHLIRILTPEAFLV